MKDKQYQSLNWRSRSPVPLPMPSVIKNERTEIENPSDTLYKVSCGPKKIFVKTYLCSVSRS